MIAAVHDSPSQQRKRATRRPHRQVENSLKERVEHWVVLEVEVEFEFGVVCESAKQIRTVR